MREKNEWILNVLDDLHAYSENEGLSELQKIISITRRIAEIEVLGVKRESEEKVIEFSKGNKN